RRHRLVGEGIEPLLHLAEHVLPDRGRIVALVCHWRPPKIDDEYPPVLVIPHCCDNAVNIVDVIYELGAFCSAKNRVIEPSSQYHRQGNSQGERINPSAAA